MTFFEILSEAKSRAINPIDLMTANEVDFHLRHFLQVDEIYDGPCYRAAHEMISQEIKDIYLSEDESFIESTTIRFFRELHEGYREDERKTILELYGSPA